MLGGQRQSQVLDCRLAIVQSPRQHVKMVLVDVTKANNPSVENDGEEWNDVDAGDSGKRESETFHVNSVIYGVAAVAVCAESTWVYFADFQRLRSAEESEKLVGIGARIVRHDPVQMDALQADGGINDVV